MYFSQFIYFIFAEAQHNFFEKKKRIYKNKFQWSDLHINILSEINIYFILFLYNCFWFSRSLLRYVFRFKKLLRFDFIFLEKPKLSELPGPVQIWNVDVFYLKMYDFSCSNRWAKSLSPQTSQLKIKFIVYDYSNGQIIL